MNRRRHSLGVQPSPNVGMQVQRAARVGIYTALGVGLVVAMGYGVRSIHGADCLKVRGVDMVGSERVSQDEVLALADLEPGAMIFDLDLDRARERILTHPWIKNVQLRRKLPDRIRIEIEEHQARLIVDKGDLVVVNGEGVVFKAFDAADKLSLPVATGLGAASSDGSAHDEQQVLLEMLAVVDALAAQPEVWGRIDQIHWDSILGFSVVTNFGSLHNTVFHLGNIPRDQIENVERVVGKLRDLDKFPRVVFANFARDPRRVHVRVDTSPWDRRGTTLLANAR